MASRRGGCNRKTAPRQNRNEIGSAGRDLRLQVVEHLFRQAIWIGGSFDHQRRNGTENGSFCDPVVAMATEIAHDLTTAHRMADVNRVLKVEVLGECRQVVGVM